MATIFTVNYSGGYGSKYEFKADASESNVSSSGNSSKVTVNIYVRRTDVSSNGAYNNDGTPWGITIDGENFSGSSAWSTKNTSDWQHIGSASKVITHDSNGSKTISISASHTGNSASGSSKMGNASGSGTFKLTDIPRYATSVQSLKSKTSSSITMNWASDSTIDYIWYSKDNGSNWTGINVTDGKSGSYTISNLSANTTYKIKTRVRRKDSQLKTDSSVLPVTTYAKTIPTISLSSKTVNSITVSSICNVAVSGTQYRIKTSNGSYGNYQTSSTFSGLNPNTAYIIEVKKVGSASGESGTATLSVTTYDIARISSYNSNINLGDSYAIKYTNPSGAKVQVGIYNTDSRNYYAEYRTVTGSSYTFNFTDAELDSMYKAMGKTNSLSAKLYINTADNTYRESKNITIKLTGNQKTEHVKINNSWKRAKRWVNVNGTWKRCIRWVNVNGTWKRCI